MRIRGGGWMRRQKRAMILTLLVAGCVSAPRTSPEALCDGSRAARAEHAQRLAESADAGLVLSGQRLIALIDAGCRR